MAVVGVAPTVSPARQRLAAAPIEARVAAPATAEGLDRAAHQSSQPDPLSQPPGAPRATAPPNYLMR